MGKDIIGDIFDTQCLHVLMVQSMGKHICRYRYINLKTQMTLTIEITIIVVVIITIIVIVVSPRYIPLKIPPLEDIGV